MIVYVVIATVVGVFVPYRGMMFGVVMAYGSYNGSSIVIVTIFGRLRIISYLCIMERGEVIVLFNLTDRTMDVYRDHGPVAERLGMPRTTLQSKLRTGVQYTGDFFVGYGVLHKSGRGRK